MIKVENQEYETFTHSQRAYLIGNTLKRTSDTLSIILFFLVGIAILSLFIEGITLAAIETIAFSPFMILLYFRLRRINKQLNLWIQEYMKNTYVLVFNTTIPKGKYTAEKIFNLAKKVFPELQENYSKFYTIDKIGHLAIRLFFTKLMSKKTVRIVTDEVNSKVDNNKYYIDLAIKTLEGYFIVKDFNEKIVTLDELRNFLKIIDKTINKQKIKKVWKFNRNPKIFRLVILAKNYDQQFLERDSLEKTMTEELKINFKVDLIIEDNIGYTILWTG